MRDFSTLDGPGPAKFQELVVRFKHLIPTKMVEICQAMGFRRYQALDSIH